MVAEWVRVCVVAECPPGKVLGVRCGNAAVCLINADGSLYAFEDRCSHQEVPLSEGGIENGTLE